ncbi:MAG: type II toxin-antitoxin system RelE/ParE family toxin [Thermoanaerobaculia bacterium]|nr:type II toxin-antitoxin system RelE/ParE family toxin [Thermoanaerobaculia bacterium]
MLRELLRLPRPVVERIQQTVESLSLDPRPPGAKKLTAREGYRVRVGNYRILYLVEDKSKLVRIYRLGDRKDVYR